jgi:hypothetical protein
LLPDPPRSRAFYKYQPAVEEIGVNRKGALLTGILKSAFVRQSPAMTGNPTVENRYREAEHGERFGCVSIRGKGGEQT